MKMKPLFKKSGLALAIATLSAGSLAGIHGYDGNSEGATVLANEIFGPGSADTLVAFPVNVYEPNTSGILATNVATVKYTLDRGAVFGEDLSDIDKWAASNATLEFVFTTAGTVTVGGAGSPYAQDPDFTIVVDQGGAIGDNTVTFQITNTGVDDTLEEVSIGQVRLKNLTGALARGVSNPQVRLGAEFRNVNTGDTDTQPALVILRSQDGVELDGDITNYLAAGGRARIDVADTELSFTGNLPGNTGANAAQDFDSDDNVAFVNLGSVNVVRTEYDGLLNPDLVVRKENGDEFDFQGSDVPVITLASSSPLTAYSSLYLRPDPLNACDATPVPGTDKIGSVAGDGLSASFNLSGDTTNELEGGYRVCLIAAGTQIIPESTFTAELNVTYFNPRYTESQDTLNLGPVLRNGCQVTLFNVPNKNAQDNAFIRLTNVSELPGSVRAFAWTEDGQRIDQGSVLLNSLDGHATHVFHTNEGLASGTYLGSVMPQYDALTTGRHRLVLQGAFPACEALGLVRSPNGTLVNMTSTTYSGDPNRLGVDNSNTSNTSN